MGLLDGLQPPSRNYTCRIAEIIKDLDAKDAKILQDAVKDDKSWTVNGLMVALRTRGIKVSTESISRHRTGTCTCSKI